MFEEIHTISARDFIAQRKQADGVHDSARVVILDGDIGPLDVAEEELLSAFVERGGGLVCIGDAVEAYHEYPALGEVLGNAYGICATRSEIIARVANADHYMTRRVDPAFAVLEAVYLLEGIPSDAEVLWKTSWRYATYTLAFARNYGEGRVFCTTLGSAAQTRQHPVFRQMIERAVRYTAGGEYARNDKARGDDWLWRNWL